MRFLIITNHSYMLWQFRRELIAELLKRGEVLISMPFVGHAEDFGAMGCRCIETKLERRGMNPLAEKKLYRTYRKLLEKERPDMVITYSIKPNIYAGFACRKLGIPYCVNVQGLGTAFQKKSFAIIVSMMYRAALKDAKAVFFENDANADEFLKRRIVSGKQRKRLPGAGVNLDLYNMKTYPDESEGIHFLFLSRIMKEKGVEEFFEAAARIKEAYGPKVIFDMVGFFEEDYKEAIEDLVRKEIVVFHGFQPDPRPYYEKCHCVVLPSYHEGMSNVLLEAASTGRALITTDIPGCREAVEEGINGFLCRRMDADSLYLCMECFLSLPSDEREEMGRAGRRKMEREFDRCFVVERVLQALE